MKTKSSVILVILILICLLTMSLYMSSCSLFSNTNSEPTEEEIEAKALENEQWVDSGRYKVIELEIVKHVDEDGGRHNYGTMITLYDKETKVMYLYINAYRLGGGLTMLVNPDGTPKLYNE